MKWGRVDLLIEEDTSDALNRHLGSGTYKVIKKTKGMITPWSIEEANYYGAKYTESHVKVALPIHFRKFPMQATHAKLYDPTAPFKIDKPLAITGRHFRGERFVTIECEAVRT